MKAKEIERKQNQLLNRVTGIEQLVKTKNLGLNMKRITPILNDLKAEIKSQSQDLIDEANTPKAARAPKKILADIKKEGKVTPELLDEIARALK